MASHSYAVEHSNSFQVEVATASPNYHQAKWTREVFHLKIQHVCREANIVTLLGLSMTTIKGSHLLKVLQLSTFLTLHSCDPTQYSSPQTSKLSLSAVEINREINFHRFNIYRKTFLRKGKARRAAVSRLLVNLNGETIVFACVSLVELKKSEFSRAEAHSSKSTGCERKVN